MTKIILSAIPILAAILVGGTILPSFANNVMICDNTHHITGGAIINADVVVPVGHSCTISSSTVNGDITNHGIQLVVRSSNINGNISSDSFAGILITGEITSGPTIVDGNISVVGAIDIEIGVFGPTSVSGNVRIQDTNSGNIISTPIGKNLALDGIHGTLNIVNVNVGKNFSAENSHIIVLSSNTIVKNAKCLNIDALVGVGNSYGNNNNGCPV